MPFQRILPKYINLELRNIKKNMDSIIGTLGHYLQKDAIGIILEEWEENLTQDGWDMLLTELEQVIVQPVGFYHDIGRWYYNVIGKHSDFHSDDDIEDGFFLQTSEGSFELCRCKKCTSHHRIGNRQCELYALLNAFEWLEENTPMVSLSFDVTSPIIKEVIESDFRYQERSDSCKNTNALLARICEAARNTRLHNYGGKSV